MRIHTSLRLLLALPLVALSACSGGGGSGATLDRTPVASTMTPTENGFTFANFSAKKVTEEFGAEDLVAMFGNSADVCVGGKEPCVPTAEAAAFARMVNQARASGHCEGLVALAASRFVEKVSPATKDLAKDTDVVHAILRAFATQFLPASQTETNGWAKKSIDTILAAIAANLKKDVPEFTLNLYTDHGGHALLPLSIDFPDNDHAVVHVYDSNWPDKDRYVSFDLKKKEWSFSFSGKDQANDPKMWSGKKGDLDLTSLTSRTTGTCPFCGAPSKVRNTMLVIRSVDKKIEVTTDNGTLTPDNMTAGEATMRPLAGPGAEPAPGQPRDYVVTIPASNKKSTLKIGTEARIVAITPDSIGEVRTPSGGSDAPIQFNTDGISVNDPFVQLTLAAGDNAITAEGSNNSISFTDGTITATVDGAGGKPVVVTTTADAPAAEVVGAGAGDLPDQADHVVRVQNTDGQVEETVVNTDGTEKTTKVDGQLDNTSTSPNLSAPLAQPDEVPGLPPESERAADEGATTTTTTVAADNTGTSDDGNGTTKTTVKPKTTGSTAAPKTASRTAVSVGVNLDEWSFGPSDPASSGFNASLTITDGNPATCSTASCLEGMAVDGVSTGTDSATGRTVTTTSNFTMKSVTVPFSVRCGTSGSWTAATSSGGTYSASCSISSVTKDETIYLRA
jgi:hypothetical protein